MALKLIDDRDPAITFSSPPPGLWDWNRNFGGPPEYMSTTSLSGRKGATATFSFEGSSVSVYGTISTNVTVSAVSSYAIDGGSPTFFTAPVVTQAVYRTPFFQSSTLSPGSHTLVIRNEADDDYYWFDYIAVSPSDGTVSPPASSSAGGLPSNSTSTATRTSPTIPTPSPTPSPPSATASPSGSSSSSSAITTPSGLALASQSSVLAPSSTVPLVTPPPNNQADSQNSTSNHTAAIIGGSIGAAIIIALLTGVVVWQYMRRRHRRTMDARLTNDPAHHHPGTATESTLQSSYSSNTSVTPFLADGSVPTTQVFLTKTAMSGSQSSPGTAHDPPPMYQPAM